MKRQSRLLTIYDLIKKGNQHDTDLIRLKRACANLESEIALLCCTVLGGGEVIDFPPPPPPPTTTTTTTTTNPTTTGDTPDECCLWEWDGDTWVILVDNTPVDCDCNPPAFDGNNIGHREITCCDTSTTEPCIVPWWYCDLPCEIDVEINSSDTDFLELDECWRYDGTYHLTYNFTEGYYENGSCYTFSQDFGGGITIYWAYRVRATPSGVTNVISVSLDSWSDLSPVTCTDPPDGGNGADCVVDQCDPTLHAYAATMASCGENEVTITGVIT